MSLAAPLKINKHDWTAVLPELSTKLFTESALRGHYKYTKGKT